MLGVSHDWFELVEINDTCFRGPVTYHPGQILGIFSLTLYILNISLIILSHFTLSVPFVDVF